MVRQTKWRLAVLYVAIMVSSALLGFSVQAQSLASGKANTAVAVMLNTTGTYAAKAEVADERRVEVLLLQAQQRHEACSADVKDLMDQAYYLIFPGVEIPLGGDVAMLVVK